MDFCGLEVQAIGGELCRFDGAIFKKYIPDPQKSGSHKFRLYPVI